MLKELYKYAVDNGITACQGFKERVVRYYISFDVNGNFVGFDAVEDGKKATCPDMGSAAQSTTKSNIIVEKAEIVLNLPDKDGQFPRQAKHDFICRQCRKSRSSALFSRNRLNLLKSSMMLLFQIFRPRNLNPAI